MKPFPHGIADSFFREQQRYSIEELLRADITTSTGHPRQEDTGDIMRVIDYLLHLRINRKPVFTVSRESSDGTTSPNTYQFNFVGILTAGPYLFAVLPKYYRGVAPGNITGHETEVIDEFTTIMEAIRRYNVDPNHRHDTIGFDYEPDGDDADGNLIDLYRFLLDDFTENGLYQSTRRITESNGYGEIDWNRTISRIMPLRSAASHKPVYVDVISTRPATDTTTIVRSIQAAVVSDISRHLNSSGLNALFRLPTAEPSPKTLVEIGEADQLERLLWRELRTQFVTQKRLLLHALIRYLHASSGERAVPMLAQGTCSFNLVWEAVCKKLFNDDASLHATEPVTWSYRDPLEWRSTNVADHHRGNDIVTTTDADADDIDGSSLEPDVVALDGSGDKRYIIDAKYYIPRYEPSTPAARGRTKGGVSHAPGLKDIVKQYFYLLALMPQDGATDPNGTDDALGAHRTITAPIAGNAFVMPGRIPLIPDPDGHPGFPARDNRRLLVRRGATYFPFMTQRLQAIYGRDVPSVIDLFEMDPEQALRLYQDDHATSRERGLARLTAMFSR